MKPSEVKNVQSNPGTEVQQGGFRIVTDGLIIFARTPLYLKTLILEDIVLLKGDTLDSNVIEIFRCFRLPAGRIRHDGSKIKADKKDKSLIISDLYFTPSFGISIALDSELAKFDLKRNEQPEHSDLLFLTLDGVKVDPECYSLLV